MGSEKDLIYTGTRRETRATRNGRFVRLKHARTVGVYRLYPRGRSLAWQKLRSVNLMRAARLRLRLSDSSVCVEAK